MYQKIIANIQLKAYYWYYKIFAQKYKISLGKNVKVDAITSFEGENRIGNNTTIIQTKIGYSSYLGSNSKFVKTNIGRYTSIAPEVRVVSGHHPIDEYVSTSPVFYSQQYGGRNTYVDREFYNPYTYVDDINEILVNIGSDVWIGEGVKIVEGVNIGDGAVVAAYSIVTKDLEPYGVYAGVPAKLVKYRFDKEYIDKLLELKWWNKSEEWLKARAHSFRDLNSFWNDIDNGEDV